MRIRLVLVLVLVVAGCTSSSNEPTGPTSSTSTTTTTIDNDTCDRVAKDTAEYLDDLIDTLDETRLRVLTDVDAWPQDLRDLQRAGKDLDLRVNALRCDPVQIQQFAFAQADLDPNGPLSEELLRVLLSSEPLTSTPTTTGTTVAETATTVDSGTSGG